MRRFGLAVLLASLAATSADESATVATHVRSFRVVALQVSAPFVGQQVIAYKPTATSMHVRRADNTSFDVTVGDECSPANADDNLVLVNCDRPASDAVPFVLDTTTTRLVAVPNWQPGDYFSQVGNEWISGGNCSGGQPAHCHGGVPIWLNWHTGVRTGSARDLDASDQPPAPNPQDHFPRLASVDDWDRTPGPANDLVIRTSAHRRIRLSGCATGCGSATFNRRFVAWIEHGRVVVRNLRRGRSAISYRPAVPLAVQRDYYSFAALRLTPNRLVLTTRTSEATAYDIQQATLPDPDRNDSSSSVR
jgi:hypothetical protein